MNKVLRFLLVFTSMTLLGEVGLAQSSGLMSTYGPGYVMVKSYEGAKISGHVLHFQLRNPMNIPNWSVRARINGPIIASTGPNISGLPFPAENIHFKFSGTGVGTPTPTQINVPLNPQPLQVGQTLILPSSAAPLVNVPISGGKSLIIRHRRCGGSERPAFFLAS